MILNQDCMSITPEWASQFACLITDPPYSRHVHSNTISQSAGGGTRERDLGFGYLTPKLRRHVAKVAASVQRWAIIYSDVESSTWLRISCEVAGSEYVRTIPWVRWSMPQLSGTVPPQGFEHLLAFHAQHVGKRGGRRPKGKEWAGPGNLTALRAETPEELDQTCLRGDTKHKAEKPLDQALELVSWFSKPGEFVLDCFAGSGVFGLACALLDRHYVGFELDPKWAEIATLREQIANISTADIERVTRWVTAPDDSAMTKPSQERKALRHADKMLAVTKLAA
jgi:site-specific DNA-methyltransferase (adenine-specific)